MKEISILHITDFHILNPSENLEVLSKLNYESYFNGLIKAIQDKGISIHYIVASGDFVDQGIVENFEHAFLVISYLAERLNVNISNISICIGNHDIKKVNGKDDKTAYKKFAMQFPQISNPTACGNLEDENDLFHLSKLSHTNTQNVYMLSLDATFEREGSKPGRLKPKIANSIFKQLKTHIEDNSNNLIVICSHYPMTIFYEENFNNDTFFNDCLWQSGMPFFARLKALFKRSKLLWLCGDLHYQDFVSEENGRSIALLTGRIGTSFPNREKVDSLIANSKNAKNENHLNKKTPTKKKIIQTINDYAKNVTIQKREASVIQYPTNKDINITKFVFNPYGHNDSLDGRWISHNPEKIKYSFNVPEIISSELEIQLYEYISDMNLYKFGIFETREADEVTLGWVSLNSLLGNVQNLQQIVFESKKYLDLVLTQEEKIHQKNLILGIDFWGSIIASQLSIITNFKNHCRSSSLRTTEDDLMEIEQFCSGLELTQEENIIIITDVLSTGRTLKDVYEKVNNYFISKQMTIKKVIVISVLCDKNQDRKVNLDFVTVLSTCCSKVSIPVIDKNNLPDEKLIPRQRVYF